MKVQIENKLDIVSLKLPHNLILEIDKLAKKEDRSRSSLIRRFLTKSIENYREEASGLNKKMESSFLLSSNKIFATEWESENDDKAFTNLQKYKKHDL